MKFDRVIAIRNTITIFRDGDQCIKCFHNAYSKEDILNEALNQTRMEATALLVPQIHEVVQIDGKWSIIMEFIRGKTLEQHMLETPERTREHLELLAELQSKVWYQNAPMLPQQKTVMLRNITRSITNPAVLAFCQEQLDSLPTDPHVCHGNLEPSNIVIADDGQPYLLDWMYSSIGNIAVDVASTHLSLKKQYGQNTAEQYLNIICRKNAMDHEHIRKWIPLAAAYRFEFSQNDEFDYN